MTKRPCSSLSAERDRFVPASVAVIFTPGTSAPEGSVMVPPILPKPCANTEIGVISNTANTSRRAMIFLLGYVSHIEMLFRDTRFRTSYIRPGNDVKRVQILKNVVRSAVNSLCTFGIFKQSLEWGLTL